MRRTIRNLITLAACAVLFAAAAHADIAAFNAAVKANNFKTAAAEAAKTWPTLDKSRDDIVIIAQEFGFSAFVAKDYAAARTYADFAVAAASTSPENRTIAVVLATLAAHKVKPTADTRAALAAALTARTAFPGLDNITFLGADALLAYDMEKADWEDATESARLLTNFTDAGGASFLVSKTRARLYWAIADYMLSKKATAVAGLHSLQDDLVRDINAAASDERAKPMIGLYWEIVAWRELTDSHLRARGILPNKPDGKQDEEEAEEDDPEWAPTTRAKRLMGDRTDTDVCKTQFDMTRIPNYPSSALYSGFLGSVILQVDIDAAGRASNPEILTAVPEKFFGKAVLDSVRYIRVTPGKPWDAASCSLAQTGKRITFKFMIPR